MLSSGVSEDSDSVLIYIKYLFIYLFIYFIYLFWFFETGFLCIALAGTHSVDQASLELRNLPASAS